MGALCGKLVRYKTKIALHSTNSSESTDDLVKNHQYHGFPVLCGVELVGYVTRDKLMMTIEALFSNEPMPSPQRQCIFSKRRPGPDDGEFEALSDILEEATLQLRKELPQELVVNMFQKLVSRLLVNPRGVLNSCRTCDTSCLLMKES